MIKYDPTVIQQFVETLYRKAQALVVTYTITGILTGLFGGGFIGVLIHATNRRIDDAVIPMLALPAAVVLGIIANQIAQGKAFWLKLQAQIALCQVEIEKNTHKTPQSESITFGELGKKLG